MKRLISAADVKAAAEHGGVLTIDDNTIVTPQAKDEAAELGVELVFGAAPAATQHKTAEPAPEHHEAPVAHEPEHHKEHEAAMSALFAALWTPAFGANSRLRIFLGMPPR